MRVALAQYGNKTEDISLEAETRAIRLDQAFTGQLGGAIKAGLHGKGTGLGSRKHVGLAVDRAGGRESDPSNTVLTHRLEDIERRDRILLQIAARMTGAEAHVGVRRQMKDDVMAGRRGGKGRQIEYIGLDQPKSLLRFSVREKLALSRAEVVHDSDRMSLSQQT